MNSTLAGALTTLKNTVKWQMSSSLIHGLMSTMSGAVSYVKQMDSALNDIRIVTGKSTEEMARFASYANKAAKELSTTTQEYAKAALIYYQQGDDDRTAAEKAAITAKAANVAFTASAKEMSEMLTAVWNSYQVGTDQLEHTVDVMAKLGATTASSMEEMATGMQKVAATANTVGVSMEQMSAMIATSASVTRQAPQTIGTAWNTILSRIGGLKLGETLEDGVDLNKYSKALQTIGVDILDARGELRDMGSVIDEIGAKWDTLGEATKSALAQTIGGARQYTQILAFFENFDKYQANMQTALNADGALQEQADIYAESWEAASQRVKAATQGIYSDLINNKAMTTSLNVLEQFINTISGVIKSIGGLPGLLAVIASYSMNAFGPEIAQHVVNLGNHLKTTFTGAKSEQELFIERNQALRAEIQKLASESSVLTEPQKTQVAMLDAVAEANNSLLTSSRNLSQEQIAHIQSVIKVYQEEINTVIDLMNKQQELKDKAATSQANLTQDILHGESQYQSQRTFKTDYGNLSTSQKQQMWTKADMTFISDLENSHQILQKMVPTLASVRDESKNITFSKVMSEAGKTLQSFSAVQKTVQGMRAEYGQFGQELTASTVPAVQMKTDIQQVVEKLSERTTGTFLEPAIQDAALLSEKLDEAVYKFQGQEFKVNWDTVDLSKANQTLTADQAAANPQLAQQIEEAKAAVAAIQEVLGKLDVATNSVNTESVEKLKEALLEMVPPELKSRMQEFIDDSIAAGASIADLAAEGTKLAHQMKNEVSTAIEATNQKIQAMTKIASTVTMVTTTFKTLSNTMKTLKDPNTTGWQKFGAVLGAIATIAMSTARVMSLFNDQQLMTTLQTTLLSAAQKEGFASWLLTKLGIKSVGDEAVKTQIKCWPLLIVLGLIAAVAAVIIGVVAAVNAISAASNKAAEELKEHQDELKESMSNLSTENQKLTQDLQSLNDIMHDTSLTYEEQLTKINEICKAYGVQATMLDILSGNYAHLEQSMTAAAQAQLESQSYTARTNATNAANYAQDAIDVANNPTLWGKIGLTAAGGAGFGLDAALTVGSFGLYPLLAGIFGWKGFGGEAINEAYRDHGMFENYNRGNRSDNAQEINALVNLTDEINALGFSVDAATGQIQEITPGEGQGAELLQLLRSNDAIARYANTAGSYTAGLTRQLTGYGFDTVLAAREQQRSIDLQRELFANGSNFDWLGTHGDASLSQVHALVSSTSAANANDRATLLNYLSGYSNYSTTGAQLSALNTLSQSAATNRLYLHPELDKEATENQIYEDLYAMVGRGEITIETLLKISPTDIVFDAENKTYTIDQQARKLAEARVKAQLQQEKQAQLESNKDLMTGSKFKNGDLSTLVDTGMFTEEEARAFMQRSQGEREIIWQQMYDESVQAEQEALQATIDEANARLPILQSQMDLWIHQLRDHVGPLLKAGIITADQLAVMSDEQLYQWLTDEKGRFQGIIDAEQALIDEYYNTDWTQASDKQKEDFYKKLGKSSWDEVEAEMLTRVDAVENAETQIARIESATSSGDRLAASLADTTQAAEDASDALEDTKAYNEYTSAVDRAKVGANAFKEALSQSGILTSEVLGKISLLDSAALENYKTMTSAEWDKYVYEKAVQYYDGLIEEYRKVGNEVDALVAAQEKAALRQTYLTNLSTNAKQVAENEAKAIKEIRDAISGSNSILEKIGADTSVSDLSYEQLETLRQKLRDIGYTAKEVDTIIDNLGKEDAGTEDEILAATRQQVDLLLTDIALLETQKDQYGALYTIDAVPGDNMEDTDEGLHARIKKPEPESLTVSAAPDGSTVQSDWSLAKTPSASSTIPPFMITADVDKTTQNVGGSGTLSYSNGVYTLSGVTVNSSGTTVPFTAHLGDDAEQAGFFSVTSSGVSFTGTVTAENGDTLDIKTQIADTSAIKYNEETNQLEIWGYGSDGEGGRVSTLMFSAQLSDQSNFHVDDSGNLIFETAGDDGVKLSVTVDDQNWPIILRQLQAKKTEVEEQGLEWNIPGIDLFYTWQPTPGNKNPWEVVPESVPVYYHYENDNTGPSQELLDAQGVDIGLGSGPHRTDLNRSLYWAWDPTGIHPTWMTSAADNEVWNSYLDPSFDKQDDFGKQQILEKCFDILYGFLTNTENTLTPEARTATTNMLKRVYFDYAQAGGIPTQLTWGLPNKFGTEQTSSPRAMRLGSQMDEWYRIIYPASDEVVEVFDDLVAGTMEWRDQYNTLFESALDEMASEKVGDSSDWWLHRSRAEDDPDTNWRERWSNYMNLDLENRSLFDETDLSDDDINYFITQAHDLLVEYLNENWDELSEDAKVAGVNLLLGLYNGYIGNVDNANWAQPGEKVLAYIQASLKEQSPSKATYEMGVNLMKGLSNGWQATEFEIGPLGEKVLKSIQNELSSIDNQIIADLFDDVLSYREWDGTEDGETKHFDLDEFGSSLQADAKTIQRNKALRYMEGSLGLAYDNTTRFDLYGAFTNGGLANANARLGKIDTSGSVKIKAADNGGYQIEIGDELLDTIYTSVDDAYTDALSTLFTEQRKKDWITSGYADELDALSAGLFAKARDEALAKYKTANHKGDTFSLDDWIDEAGIDNVTHMIEGQLGSAVNDLQEAIELDWGKVKDKWKSGLADCYKLSEEAAQQEYELWENTFKAIADARKIIFEEGTIGAEMSADNLAKLALGQMDEDGHIDMAAFLKGIWGGTNGGYSATDLRLGAFKPDQSGLAQYALFDSDGLWRDDNTFEGWRDRAVAGQKQFYIDRKDKLITNEMRQAADFYAQNPSEFSSSFLQNALGMTQEDADLLYSNTLSYLKSGFVQLQEQEDHTYKAVWDESDRRLEQVAEDLAWKDVGGKDNVTAQQAKYKTIFQDSIKDFLTYQQSIFSDAQNRAAASKTDYDEAVALRTKIENGEELDSREIATVENLIQTYGSLDEACQALANNAADAADATELMKLAFSDGFWARQAEDGSYEFYKSEVSEDKYESQEAAQDALNDVIEAFKANHPEITTVVGEVVPIYDGDQIVGYTTKVTGSLTADDLSQKYNLGDKASTIGLDETETQHKKWASQAGFNNTPELREYADRMVEIGEIVATDAETQLRMAKAMARAEKGFAAASKNLSTYTSTLKTADRKSVEYSNTLENLRDIYADCFDLDAWGADRLSTAFLESEQNAELLGKAIEGDDAAWDQLKANAATDIVSRVRIDDSEFTAQANEIMNQIAAFDFEANGIKVGASIDTAPFYQDLQNMVLYSQEEANAMSDALSTVGVDGTWEPTTVWVPDQYNAEDWEGQTPITVGYDEWGLPIIGYQDVSAEVRDEHPGHEETVWLFQGAKSKYKGGGSPPPAPSNSGGNGGGGGSKSAKKVQSYKKGSDEKERYHEITKQIKEQSDVLTRLDKIKTRTFGANHLKAINDEIAALEKENELYADQAREASANLEANKKILSSYGATFNEDGTINYDEYMDRILADYNAAVDRYNSSAQEAGDELALKKAEEIYNEAKKAMEDYEEDMEKLNEAQEQMLENQNKISAAMLEGIQYKVEVKMDLNDRDIKLLQYFRDKWEDMYDMQDEAMRYMTEEATKYTDNLATLNTEMKELQQAYADGKLNEADFASGMQDVNDKMLEQLNNLLTIKKSIKEAYGNTLQQAEGELQKYTAILDHSRSVMEQYINLQQLMGLGADYSGLKEMYQTQYNSSVAGVKAAKDYLDTLKQSRSEIEENIKKHGWTEELKQQWEDVTNAIIEGEDDLLSRTNQALTDAQSMFANTMNAIVQDFNVKLFGMKNGLSEMEDDYKYYQEEQERYLSTSKELYEVSKLNRQINDSIADVTTKVSKERLKALKDQINAQAESTRLTEYDVQMMELQYKYALALEELENAKNAKSVVRLTRDENGNFGYQYTADDSDISKAQQEVEDVLQQINELAANRQAEMAQARLQSEREFQDAILQIALDGSLSEEQIAEKQEELIRRHAETMQFQQEQYNNATSALLTNQQYVYQRYGTSIMSNTGMVQDQINDSVTAMMNKTDDYATYLKGQMSPGGAIYDAMQKYKNDIATVTGTSGLAGWANMVASAQDFEEANEAAVEALEDINDTLGSTLTNIADVTDEWSDQAVVINQLIALYEELTAAAAQAVRETAGNMDGTSAQASEGAATDTDAAGTGKKQYMFKWGYGGFSGEFSGYDSRSAALQGAKDDIEQKIMSTLQAGETDAETSSMRAELRAIVTRALGTIQITKYLRGGLIDYTGPAWVDGSTTDPELMLNKTDTRNILAAVETIRDIDVDTLAGLYEAINQNAMGMMYAMSGMIAPGSAGNGTLEQHVEITAEFPNATDRNEITAAFEDIVNLAAQYANRR